MESKEQPSYVKNFCQIKDTTTCFIQLNLMTSEFEKHMRWFDEFFLWTLAGLHDLPRSNLKYFDKNLKLLWMLFKRWNFEVWNFLKLSDVTIFSAISAKKKNIKWFQICLLVKAAKSGTFWSLKGKCWVFWSTTESRQL